MKPKTSRLKKRKRKQSPDELRQLKEHQKLLYLRNRRKAKQRQLMLQRIRSLFHLGAIVAIFLSIIYVMIQPYWNLNAFVFSNYPNNSLLLDGNLITKDNQILDALKNLNVENKPIYMINPSKFKQALLELDPIKKVYIRRYWLPARISIVIVERKPVFLVHKAINSAPSYAITTDSRRIDKKFLPLPEKYEKQIYDIILPGTESTWSPEIVDQYFKIARIVETTTNEKLIYLDLSRPNDVYLKLSGSMIRLGEIDATVFERLNRLKYIMPEVKKHEKNIEYVDLRWDIGLFLKERTEKKLTEIKITEEKPIDPKKIEEQRKLDAAKARTIADTMNNMYSKPGNETSDVNNTKQKIDKKQEQSDKKTNTNNNENPKEPENKPQATLEE